MRAKPRKVCPRTIGGMRKRKICKTRGRGDEAGKRKRLFPKKLCASEKPERRSERAKTGRKKKLSRAAGRGMVRDGRFLRPPGGKGQEKGQEKRQEKRGFPEGGSGKPRPRTAARKGFNNRGLQSVLCRRRLWAFPVRLQRVPDRLRPLSERIWKLFRPGSGALFQSFLLGD